MIETMKKFFTSAIVAVAVVLMAAACSEEEPRFDENSFVGAWKAPLSVGDGAIEGLGGKELVIKKDHTADFAILSFNYWKLEDDELIFTRYIDRGVTHEVDVLRYNIASLCDTVMVLVGTYMHTVGDSVYLVADMSGMYQRKLQVPQGQQ